MKMITYLIIFCSAIMACSNAEKSETPVVDPVIDENPVDSKYPLETLNLPSGFKISVFGEVPYARSLALSPSGVVYVGNRAADKVYALRDTDGDWVADESFIIASDLTMPNGVAFRDGDLYVAEVSRIIKFSNIEDNLASPPDYEVVYDSYPTEKHHGWKYIAFGPDGKLYVPVGAPCNICESEDQVYAAITRINPDGSDLEIVASGVRNTVGFVWHPDTKNLWFTDNGRDMMGDDIPPCELNQLVNEGDHFGYPYCHGNDILDPEFGSKRACNEFVKPEWGFGAHTAPLGLDFYTGEQFPEDYVGDIIVAQHGSWNRSSKVGYRLMRVNVMNSKVIGADVFIDGWLDDETQDSWGRPVDVLQMPDGSVLVSDDQAGLVYRVSYNN